MKQHLLCKMGTIILLVAGLAGTSLAGNAGTEKGKGGKIPSEPSTSIAGCTEASYIQGESSNAVTIIEREYTPKCLRVKVGSSVMIEASEEHPLNAMPSTSSEVHPLSDGSQFTTSQTRVYDQVGTYGFYCGHHGDAEGNGMAGVIMVEE